MAETGCLSLFAHPFPICEWKNSHIAAEQDNHKLPGEPNKHARRSSPSEECDRNGGQQGNGVAIEVSSMEPRQALLMAVGKGTKKYDEKRGNCGE